MGCSPEGQVIAYLEGRVLERGGETEVVVLAAGVGYRVHADARRTRAGDEVKLWIHSVTGERGTTLYGLENQTERAKFVELIGIKGVGPTTAMRILFAGANPRVLEQLVAIKGVGKKIAETIVAELGAAA